MPLTLLFSALWIYAYILSPFILLCSYNLLARIQWIASPWIVFPGVSGGGVYLFLTYYPFLRGQGFSFQGPLLYSHFLIASGLLLGLYSYLGFRMKYSKLEALTLALLTTLAIDQLWQLPLDIFNWSASLQSLETGLATGAFSFISIPVLIYFLLKFGKKPSLKWKSTRDIFLLTVTVTIVDVLAYPPDPSALLYQPYLLVIPWTVFFLALFTFSEHTFDVSKDSFPIFA